MTLGHCFVIVCDGAFFLFQLYGLLAKKFHGMEWVAVAFLLLMAFNMAAIFVR